MEAQAPSPNFGHSTHPGPPLTRRACDMKPGEAFLAFDGRRPARRITVILGAPPGITCGKSALDWFTLDPLGRRASEGVTVCDPCHRLTLAPLCSLAERVGCAEAEVSALAELAEGLREGTLDWREWNEELSCWDRQDAAAEEAATALGEAREVLARLTAEMAALAGTAVAA